MEYLSDEYPSLFVFILEQFEMRDRIEKYMAMCKTYENDPEKYTMYIHGYFLIWLHQQR